MREGEKSELKRDSSSQSGNGMVQMQMLTADNLKGIASVEVRWVSQAPPAPTMPRQRQRTMTSVLPLINDLENDIAPD